MNIKEVVIFDSCFEPTKEFEDFCKECGYSCPIMFMKAGVTSFNIDSNIVQYVKDHINWGTNGMKGARSFHYKIGFAGVATLIKVDIDRKWGIKYDNRDSPYPVYLNIHPNSINYTYIKWERANE